MAKTLGWLVALAALFVLAAPVGAQSDTDDPAQVAEGMVIFESNCAGCHGADGTGNTGRDLTDIALEQPDRSVHITSVTEGIRNMPAFGERLSADEIDAVVSYVRLEFASAQDDAEPPAEDEVEAPPAEEEPAEEELAVTGVDTPVGLITGSFLIAAGLLLLHAARMGLRLRA